MTPGREIDALVAEKVMGDCTWEIWYLNNGVAQSVHPDGLTFSCQTKEQAESYVKDFPYEVTIMTPSPKPYSTDITAAWEVVEKMKDKGFALSLTAGLANGYFGICFYDAIERKFIVDKSSGLESVPHGLCLAALSAMGVEV